ncbi:6-bladed beta-propeller [Gemmatimonadota bacterium]
MYIGSIPDYCMGISDTLYVLDSRQRVVHAVTLYGERLFAFGGHGQGPGEFESPRAIAFDGRSVYVADWSLLRLTQFSATGEYLRTITLPAQVWSLAVVDGTIYAAGATYSNAALWRITLAQEPQVSPFLRLGEGPLAEYEWPGPAGRRFITSHGALLFFSLPSHNNVVVIDPSAGQSDWKVLAPVGPTLREHRRQFEVALRELQQRGGNSGWAPFRRVVPLSADKLMLEMTLTIDGVMTGVGVVVSSQTGEETGEWVIPKDPRSLTPRLLGETHIGWVDAENAQLVVYIRPW